MSGEFVIFSVLSCSSKNLKQWTDHCYSSMLQLSFIGQAKENTSSRHEGGLTQKTRREEKTEAQFWLLFLCFFLPALSLPYVNWSSQEGCLFYLRFSLWSLDLPFFHFWGLVPSLSFSHHHFELFFPILTT